MSTIGTKASNERGRGALNHWRRPRHGVAHASQGSGEAVEKLKLKNTLMKPLTIAIIGALVVAVAVLGYLYYQRTSNDITIQVPKVELKR
jgi:hypothetical protein